MTPDILNACAAKYGTPAYLFDLTELNARTDAIRDILDGDIGLCYSIKANPFLVPAMDSRLGMLEVCSPGELEICIHNHINPDHILFSGVSKTRNDIRRAIEAGVRLFTCESRLHVTLLEAAAAEAGLILPVLLRLTAGSQFGMDISDLEWVIQNRNTCPHLSICGIHYFSGTQRKKLKDQRSELEFLAETCARIQSEFNFTIERIEYGTGLYFPYFENEDHSDTLAPIRELAPDLLRLSRQVRLTIEMGRFFASSCGTFLTAVQDTKRNKGQQYAILDGGIHHLNYYGGSMGMRVPLITKLSDSCTPDSGESGSWMLCGSLCTTADVLVRAYPASSLHPGDILAFHYCGAYSVTEAPALFLSRDMPAVILYDTDGFKQIRSSQPSWPMNTISSAPTR
ncbi:MAG: diaminopimelate decarboxylase [Clostridia bacterium]|nr:diaminopimelate decarboxylase [Clostridia bacterium]